MWETLLILSSLIFSTRSKTLMLHLPYLLASILRCPLGNWRSLVFTNTSSEFLNCKLRHFSSGLLFESEDLVFAKRKVCLFDRTVKTSVAVIFTCDSRTLRSVNLGLVLRHPVWLKDAESLKRHSKRSFSNEIKFDKLKYHVKMKEGGESDQVVLRLNAFNPDRLPLFYSMLAPEDSRSRNYFHLNRTTGELRTVSKLDREDMDSHVLRVTAYESGNPIRTATALVTVEVEDINDNVPAFERRTFVGSISESAEVGTTILHVHAHDKDAGLNGKVKYSFHLKEGDAETELFSIDSNTGVIQVRKPLDREVKELYRFTVTAADQSPDVPLSSTALVEITLNDANDNVPQFDRLRYRAEIPENLSPKHKPLVARINATDPDDGDNGRVRYSIVSGNLKDTFSLDYETGEVRLKNSLNYKSTSVYDIVIRAQDSGTTSHSNTTLLEVVVVDINDNAPQFYTNLFQKSIREDVPVGFQVTMIKAYDSDSGRNADIRYSLKPTEDGRKDFPFQINPETGEITTSKKLNREACDTCSLFRFLAVASDCGEPPLSAEVPVLITILDVNDNSPVFEKNFYKVSVREDADRGQQILRVRALDLDEESKIEYSLNKAGNEEETFLILNVENSGLITLNSELDFKTRNLYTLTVKATDSGGKSDASTVSVSVEDVNSPPFFVSQEFTVRVKENSPSGTVVTMVEARDNDEGQNAKIHYKIVGGEDRFEISRENGLISVRRNLDREQKARYDLRIIASDHGNPTLSATTSLEVVISDVNDNAPAFQQQNYTVTIPEDLPLETSFFQVSATDPDEGQNARITYSFGHKDSNDTFFIDPTSGIIRTTDFLDRERVEYYELEIFASDKGIPSKTGTTTVLVWIEDRNDNPPKFDRDIYHLYVAENEPIGTVVSRVVAKDPDVGSNAQVTYRIYGGSDMGAFELSSASDSEPGVDVITRVALDYESQKQSYNFQLQASSGDLSSVAEIFVHVQDTNDNRPVLKDFFVVFHNYRDYFPLHSLGRIPAYDPDFNDSLTYSFVSGNEAGLLILEPDTGKLQLSSTLNTNRHISAEMRACVSDGVNVVCAQCSLRVVLVTEEMLLSSVTLRAEGVSRDALLSPVAYSRLVDALCTLVPSVRDDVILFSVQENDTVGHEMEPQINISFSIRRPYSDSYVSSEELRELVHLNRKALSDVANLEILPFFDSLCVMEPCYNFEQCQNVLKFGAAPDFIVTENFLFRPIDPVSTFMCVCPPGFAGKKNQLECNAEVNLCYSSPCGSNGTCMQKENGYTCVCPPSRTGPRCEFPLRTEFCLPGICRGGSVCNATNGRIRCRRCPYAEQFSNEFCELRARSFDAESYVTLAPLKQRYRFQLELDVVTVHPNGVLLYNGRYQSNNDFALLKLKDGFPEFSFSLGGTEVTSVSLPPIPTNRMDDGRWHKLKLDYLDKGVTISVDECNVELALRYSDGIGYQKCAAHVQRTMGSRCSNPTATCYRFLDLAGPLYLGGLPDSKMSKLGLSSGLDGCIRDFVIDGKVTDLSHILTNRNSVAGCSRLSDVCSRNRPCSKPSQCSSVWNGYKCSCSQDFTGQNCTDDTVSWTLESSDSYVSWAGATEYSIPLTVGVSFRTKQRNAVVLAIAFLGSSAEKLYLFIKVVNSESALEASGQVAKLSYPKVSDGQWHTATVAISRDWIKLTVDYIYEKVWHLSNHAYFYKGIDHVYVGSLSGAVSAPFIGCIKGVFVHKDKEGKNLEYLKLTDHGIYNTRSGCALPNPCLSAPCPTNSHCLQDWDSYQCKCLPGFAGENCMDICQLNRICKNGGSCVRNGAGYKCLCPVGFSGEHCETAFPPSGNHCPSGWWGRPLCGPCKCKVSHGYSPDCNKLTGQCQCKSLHYKPPASDSCLPCDCNFPSGATNLTCHSESGQCKCRGDVLGRRCDRCHSPTAEINRTAGYCSVVYDGCPESFSRGILWPRSEFERLVEERCPIGSTGSASRFCRKNGFWRDPDLFNCTTNGFTHLGRTLSQLDQGLLLNGFLARRIAKELGNVTATLKKERKGLYGGDIYVGYRLVLAMLRYEMLQVDSSLIHIQDKHFVQDLVNSCSELLGAENAKWWSRMDGSESSAAGHLLQKLDEYGKRLAEVHQYHYLKPFQVASKNLVFAVDSVGKSKDGKVTLPKYDNFLEQMNVFDLPVSFEIPTDNYIVKEVWHPRVVFYSVYSSLKDIMSLNRKRAIGSPVVSLTVYSTRGKLIESFRDPVIIHFPVVTAGNQTRAKCVWWNSEAYSWSDSGCGISKRNETHVTCACYHLSSFAVSVHSGFWEFQFSLVEDVYLFYVAPVCGIVALMLLVAAFILLCASTLSEGSCNRRFIHQGIVLTFAANISAFLFVFRAQEQKLVCSFVGGVLHFTVMSVFAWLFLCVTHLYKGATDLRDVDKGSFWPYFGFGFILPVVISAATGLLARNSIDHSNFCWFSLYDPYVWSMVAPVAVLMLLTLYVGVMCAMIAYSKEWVAMFAKMNFRHSLLRCFLIEISSFVVWVLQFLSVNVQVLWLHYAYNIVIILYSIMLFAWVIFFDKKSPGDLKTAVSLWLNEEGTILKPSNDEIPCHYTSEEVRRPVNISHENLRADSPLLADELAPRPDEDPSATQCGGDTCSSDLAGVNARFLTLPLGTSLPKRTCHSPTILSDESVRPFLEDTADNYASLKKFSKPDLIPSWEERINVSADTLASERMTLNRSTYRSFSPMYRSPAYVSTAAAYTSIPGRSILSPATKVLFEDTVQKRMHNGTVIPENNSTRLHTFSPQHSPKQRGHFASSTEKDDLERFLPKLPYFTSGGMSMNGSLPNASVKNSETAL